MEKIFQSVRLGPFDLKNRIVMAALTRARALEDGTPTDLMTEYYRQRAESAGLIVSESVSLEMKTNGVIGTPGVETEEHAHAWKKITEAVHDQKSFIFAQLNYHGRSLHSKQHGTYPLAPSPIKIEGTTTVRGEKVPFEVPKEMTQEDIDSVHQLFVNGAKMAKLGGFDGVEIQAANGYLVDQFLKTSCNQRKDKYGGSVENRSRFLLELIDKLSEVFPMNQIGVKLSPVNRLRDMYDEDPISLCKYLLSEFEKREISYVMFRESETFTEKEKPANAGELQMPNVSKICRAMYKGTLIANGFLSGEEGIRIIRDGEADLVAFGRLFIANPDLTERLKNNWPLAKPDPSKNHRAPDGDPAKGYTDFPKYQAKPE